MEKTKEEGLSGNDRYEGFCVDLLKDIADEVDFRYTFMLVPDGKYGAPERTTEDGEKEVWTGMVRELMDSVSIGHSSASVQKVALTKQELTKYLGGIPRWEYPGSAGARTPWTLGHSAEYDFKDLLCLIC
jgi:Ligated ion channel L-glutamate- and glycine-binding site